ncbi:glycoside hydrolase family 3 protein [Myriangium duriaei CBS 260.36]|uniref:beta-glucosidase n=1 Tax=Myriangium duriaei CBS 260.36 TaxID=1168546 RepID=A0A9P4MHU9_9PEZI|nr:glycoside hydrolase family 3 protein [Myriangium duriaei CBS 260.36]
MSWSKKRNPEARYTFGRSPPVYPTPQANGDGGWVIAFAKAKALVAKMTDQEKAAVTLGSSSAQGCSGFTGSVRRLGFPGMCLNDAESGIRTAKHVSGFPAQIHVGASWNRVLTHARARALGKEFKAKGINVLLGPVVGGLGRIAKAGRNYESFSSDPYLSGELVGPSISGMQESVIACVKHLIANEQETNRTPFLQDFIKGFGNTSVSSNLDDRTMHELYLWPFYDAIKAEPGAVMCSYNKVNGSYACQNSKSINGLLKTELGFQGFVVSDWYAQHGGVSSINAGLDLAMPKSGYFKEKSLAKAVANSSISKSRLDDMAIRILAPWYRYAPFSKPGLDASKEVEARDPSDDRIRFQNAVEGHVLVKNINNALPLKKPRSLSLYGYDAVGGSNTSAAAGWLWEWGIPGTRSFTNRKPFTGLQIYTILASILPATQVGPTIALNGSLISGGGSGGITPSFSHSPYDAFLDQAALDGTKLITDFTSQNPTIVNPNDPCIVFINALSCEGWDRTTLADSYSDALVTNVANSCKNTIVVTHNAGTVVVDAWINHPNVKAVIFAHLPGQDNGLALTEIMYGRQSPSGRLPYTVAKRESDWGSLLDPTFPNKQDIFYTQSNFSEGLYIDYKSFIQRNVEPRYAFGYGLTYSKFTYSNLKISKNSTANTGRLPYDRAKPAPQGGLASLYDIIATVTVDVKNAGGVKAAEVAQLYLGVPNSGLPKVLRGFDKKLIKPGQTSTFSFALRRRDLSIWDTMQQQWVLGSGSFHVMVGKSVLDIQLDSKFSL